MGCRPGRAGAWHRPRERSRGRVAFSIAQICYVRIAEALEKQTLFPQWDTIIHFCSMLAAWVTIIYLLAERNNRRRPYLQISFELVRSSLACITFRNVGECALELSSIRFISENFVKQLPANTQERIKKLEETKIRIFPNSLHVFSLDVITSTILNEYEIKEVAIDYEYRKIVKYQKIYKEQSIIDFSQYGTMLVYISETNELQSSVDHLLPEIKEIKRLIATTKVCDTTESSISE